jgi:hypothetical protein
MNERIKEIAFQAGAEFYADTILVNGKDADDLMRKFAELLVRECITICDTVSADYLKHRKVADDFQDKNIYAEGEAACDIIKYKMKKQLGVEE